MILIYQTITKAHWPGGTQKLMKQVDKMLPDVPINSGAMLKSPPLTSKQKTTP